MVHKTCRDDRLPGTGIPAGSSALGVVTPRPIIPYTLSRGRNLTRVACDGSAPSPSTAPFVVVPFPLEHFVNGLAEPERNLRPDPPENAQGHEEKDDSD